MKNIELEQSAIRQSRRSERFAKRRQGKGALDQEHNEDEEKKTQEANTNQAIETDPTDDNTPIVSAPIFDLTRPFEVHWETANEEIQFHKQK